MTRQPPAYRYHGARAMVLMHEQSLREFLIVWREAEAMNLPLPETDDSDYTSLAHVLRHVLACARGYMLWCCKVLALPDPGIKEAPLVEHMIEEADAYLDHLLEHWIVPLAAVEEKTFYLPEHKANWGTLYCVDSMLEHAVMHPLRHSFQLRSLIRQRTTSI